MIARVLRLAGWVGWALVCLWGAWQFWRPVLLGWSIPRPVTDPGYGVRLAPLSREELAAARAREAAVRADPEAFAGGS